jgi:hypothetical protein
MRAHCKIYSLLFAPIAQTSNTARIILCSVNELMRKAYGVSRKETTPFGRGAQRYAKALTCFYTMHRAWCPSGFRHCRDCFSAVQASGSLISGLYPSSKPRPMAVVLYPGENLFFIHGISYILLLMEEEVYSRLLTPKHHDYNCIQHYGSRRDSEPSGTASTTGCTPQ